MFRIVPLATKSRNDREIWPKPFLQRNQKEDTRVISSARILKSQKIKCNLELTYQTEHTYLPLLLP